ncbi:hypothetical protein ABK040_016304 [Willaertia magna]
MEGDSLINEEGSVIVLDNKNNGVLLNNKAVNKRVNLGNINTICYSLKDISYNYNLLLNIFIFLSSRDVIKVSNICRFWRQVIREAAYKSKRLDCTSNEIDLYQRECKRLWPYNSDVSRYPIITNFEHVDLEKDVVDEESNKTFLNVNILDAGGYREMLLTNNSENELFPIVFLDIAKKKKDNTNPTRLGTIEIKLNKKVCPKLGELFRVLCTGELGLTKTGIQLHLKGCMFDSALLAFCIKGGDLTGDRIVMYSDKEEVEKVKDLLNSIPLENNNFKHKYFDLTSIEYPSENLNLKHDVGSISTNHENPKQFIITTNKCTELNGKNTVFGEVIKGSEIVKLVETTILQSEQQQTNEVLFIQNCGQVGYTGPTFERTIKQLHEHLEKIINSQRLDVQKSKVCTIF